jgi:hypothetical protein
MLNLIHNFHKKNTTLVKIFCSLAWKSTTGKLSPHLSNAMFNFILNLIYFPLIFFSKVEQAFKIIDTQEFKFPYFIFNCKGKISLFHTLCNLIIYYDF